MTAACCDCCGHVAIELVTMPGFEEVLLEPVRGRRRPAVEIHGAPRRASCWCLPCAREHERWKEEAQSRRPPMGPAKRRGAARITFPLTLAREVRS
jgi:hypothetical protein